MTRKRSTIETAPRLIATRVSPEVRERFEQYAKAHHRSMDGQLRALIEEALAAESKEES